MLKILSAAHGPKDIQILMRLTVSPDEFYFTIPMQKYWSGILGKVHPNVYIKMI